MLSFIWGGLLCFICPGMLCFVGAATRVLVCAFNCASTCATLTPSRLEEMPASRARRLVVTGFVRRRGERFVGLQLGADGVQQAGEIVPVRVLPTLLVGPV